MNIDWITVTAQIVNFLILVWLLRRFLYKPVIDAMDQREAAIASRMEDAKTREIEADGRAGEYQAKVVEIEAQRDKLLARAREEAEAESLKLLDQARDEIAETRRNWHQQLLQEREEFLGGLQRQAASTIQTIATKALQDLADVKLEEQVVHAFLAQFSNLDPEAASVLGEHTSEVQIASAFELDGPTRSRLTRAVHEHIAPDVDVKYTQAPELLCGLELTGGGRQVSWSLADYLEELSSRIEQTLSLIEPVKQGS